MHAQAISVSAAIAAHRDAYRADDDLYGDDHRPITKDRKIIRAHDALERSTLIAFAAVPCCTHDDVQLKLTYLMLGIAANQVTVWDALSLDRYAAEEWKGTGQSPRLQECLATLLLPTANRANASRVHAREGV